MSSNIHSPVKSANASLMQLQLHNKENSLSSVVPHSLQAHSDPEQSNFNDAGIDGGGQGNSNTEEAREGQKQQSQIGQENVRDVEAKVTQAIVSTGEQATQQNKSLTHFQYDNN